ncbi:MAG: type II secretion system F family protein [Paracoccaceae bacterium]
MNGLLGPLTANLGDFGPVVLVGALGILLVVLTLPMLLRKSDDPLEKLKRSRADAAKAKAGQAQLRARDKQDKLEKYSTFLEPQDAEQYSAVRMTLLRAGYRSKASVRMFYLIQFVLGISGLLIGLGYMLYTNAASEAEPDMPMTIAKVLIPAMIGYMGPKRWVNSRAEARQKEIERGFPDALDLLLVCVEAGQSLDQAILRVAKEMKTSYPALSEEFQLVSYEIKAGKDRSNVLRDFGERAGVPDVNSFVTVLIQSTQFGTPVSEALRVYSAEMRDKRLMRAEEAANKLPTKMTLVTMGLTVPPLLLILVGPSVYDVVTTLGGDKPLF